MAGNTVCNQQITEALPKASKRGRCGTVGRSRRVIQMFTPFPFALALAAPYDEALLQT
jgi:beta-glucosidase-like glycosyl hydrolase